MRTERARKLRQASVSKESYRRMKKRYTRTGEMSTYVLGLDLESELKSSPAKRRGRHILGMFNRSRNE
jgi:hypothetical protein